MTELVSNGTFTSSTAGWTPTNDVLLSVNSGRLQVEYQEDNNIANYAGQVITGLTNGATYRYSVSAIPSGANPANSQYKIIVGDGISLVYNTHINTVDSTHSGTFVSVGTQAGFSLYVPQDTNTFGEYMLYDNVSLVLVPEVELPYTPGSVSNRRRHNSRYRMILAPNVVNIMGNYVDNFWTAGTGWSVSDGVATATTSTANLTKDGILTSGNTYRVTYHVTVSGGSVRPIVGTTNGTTVTATGRYSEDIVSAGADFSFDAVTSFSGTIDEVEVRLVGS